MSQLRLGDLVPERSDDHISLNISTRDSGDFGSPQAETSTKSIVVDLTGY